MVEQLLSSLMGTADTMMVSNVGSAAISAVSLVDAINILVIQALSALAAGGAILCSQYLGSQNLKKAKRSAEQVLFVMLVLSCSLSLLCLIFRFPLLRLIFGTVDTDVMANSQIYFFFTLLSFPFIGLYDARCFHSACTKQHQRSYDDFHPFQLLKYRRKCDPDLRLGMASPARQFPPWFPVFSVRSS